MKRRLLTFLTLVLTVLLSLSIFTACGGNGDNNPPAHTHEYKTIKYDAQSHWFECECGDKNSVAFHNLVDNACVCGYFYSPAHTHEYKTIKYDAQNHWFECECGEKSGNEEHKGGTATEMQKANCSVCNQPYGSVLGHTHSFNEQVIETKYLKTPAKCESKAVYYYSCSCGEKGTSWFEYGDILNHSFTRYYSDKNATYESDGTKTAICDNGCNKTHTLPDVGSMLVENQIRFNNLSVDGTLVYGKVSNATTEFDFNNEITESGKASYVVALNEYGSNQVLTKKIPLSIGDNVVYVFEMIDNEINKTYQVTIRRKPIYSVNFVTNGSQTESQNVEEDGLAIEPSAPIRAGYDFDGFDYNFETPITGNTTITALWIAHVDTPYTVEYYLENIEDEGYSKIEEETETLTGTTDSTVYAEIKTFEHFTAEKEEVSGNINGDGLTVIKVYYQRNEYTVSISIGEYGTSSGSGTYKYGAKVNIKATAPLGYYSAIKLNEQLIGKDECEYVINRNAEFNVEFILLPEMEIFTFTSTATTCEITWLRDRTKTSIVIPDFVTSIGYGTFSNCDSLTNIEIPASVTSIDKEVFYSCNKLVCINVNENNQYYKSIDGNLYSKDGKTLIQYAIGKQDYLFVIPSSVTSIGEDAFYSCLSLTSIEIPASVTSIGDYAFNGCFKLVEVYNKSSLNISIGSRDNGCVGLNALAIYTEPYVSKLSTVNDYLIYTDGAEKILISYFGDDADLVLPSGISCVYGFAFNGYTSLTSVKIPNSVTSIGSRVFGYCDLLENVTFGEDSKLTTIGSDAFSNCSSLTSIEIPACVTSIGSSAFGNCDSLTSINVNEKNEYYKSIDGNLYSKDGKILIQYARGKQDSSFEIPDSVTSIGSSAFALCSSLTNVVIGDSVTSIGSFAFAYCSSLTIYCQAESKPSGWNEYWNGYRPVVWGYKG